MSALYLRAARVVTGRPAEVIEDGAVHVVDGRVVSVGPAGAAPSGAHERRFPRATLLPGLIDAHVHLTFRRGELSQDVANISEAEALRRGEEVLPRLLAAGVTTVRDCGAKGRTVQQLRDRVAAGALSGPRILASGAPVTSTGGHLWPIGLVSDTAEQCRQAVRRLVADGADFVKVCATGGSLTPGSIIGRAQYTTDQLRAIVEEAHAHGRRVAAHAHGVEGIARATEAGVDTIEHCSWLGPDGQPGFFDEAVARQMAARGVIANIASSPPPDVISYVHVPAAPPEPPSPTASRVASIAGVPSTAPPDLHQPSSRWEHARRLRALGVQVCFSTDAIYGWHDGDRDMAFLARVLIQVARFDPLDVIHMLTAEAAAAIGQAHSIGTVEAGKVADLLVLDGDPLHDTSSLDRVEAVFTAGIEQPLSAPH